MAMETISLRPATPDDAEGIAIVRIDSWRKTYRGIIPDTYLDQMDIDESTSLWRRVLTAASQATSVFVAERDGEVAGFAAGKMLDEERFGLNAELAAIYLRPDIQRVGIGHSLIRLVAAAHQVQGANGLLAWVIAKNKIARQFYEKLGAELLVEQGFNWDGMDLMEVGYGWRDLSIFKSH